MFDELYRNSRLRITGLAGALTEEQLGTRVAACPQWSGLQLIAHLVGVAADMVEGNLAGAPLPPWTAAQVQARAGRTVDELIEEWRETGPQVEAGLADRRFGVPSVFDIVTHEADLRETYDLGQPPASDVAALAAAATKGVLGRFPGPGSLVIRSGDQEWSGGEGEPRTVLTVAPYELLRGLVSRRSRKQMLAWPWVTRRSVDLAELIETLPFFGMRDDDQPVPA
jgi:uncharacterized protein (TIGR03083 family)